MRAVLTAMSDKGWSNLQFATEAKIDPGTAGDFLRGTRWPKLPTLAKIDSALGWTPGTLAALGEGLLTEPQVQEAATPAPETGDLVYRRPEGLSDDQWLQMKSEMGEWLEWQAERIRRAANAARGTGSDAGTPRGLSRNSLLG